MLLVFFLFSRSWRTSCTGGRTFLVGNHKVIVVIDILIVMMENIWILDALPLSSSCHFIETISVLIPGSIVEELECFVQ